MMRFRREEGGYLHDDLKAHGFIIYGCGCPGDSSGPAVCMREHPDDPCPRFQGVINENPTPRANKHKNGDAKVSKMRNCYMPSTWRSRDMEGEVEAFGRKYVCGGQYIKPAHMEGNTFSEAEVDFYY